MDKQPLHITNGGVLTKYLIELEVVGEKITWQEMLCEGPTQEIVHTDEFIDVRSTFLNEFYNVDLDLDKASINKISLSSVGIGRRGKSQRFFLLGGCCTIIALGHEPFRIPIDDENAG